MITTELPHNGTDTSQEAAVSMQEAAGRLERLCLDTIIKYHGLTCDQVEAITGLSHQCASARINALKKRGAIFDTGLRIPTRSGRKAIVWRQSVAHASSLPS